MNKEAEGHAENPKSVQSNDLDEQEEILLVINAAATILVTAIIAIPAIIII